MAKGPAISNDAYQAITTAIKTAFDQFAASSLSPEAAILYCMSEIGLRLEEQQNDEHFFSAEQFYIDCGLAKELHKDLKR